MTTGSTRDRSVSELSHQEALETLGTHTPEWHDALDALTGGDGPPINVTRRSRRDGYLAALAAGQPLSSIKVTPDPPSGGSIYKVSPFQQIAAWRYKTARDLRVSRQQPLLRLRSLARRVRLGARSQPSRRGPRRVARAGPARSTGDDPPPPDVNVARQASA